MSQTFVQMLEDACSQAPGRICFTEPEDTRILEAAKYLLQRKLVSQVHFMASAAKCQALDKEISNWSSQCSFHDVDQEHTLDQAAELLHNNECDAVLGGNRLPTAAVIRAGITGIGLAAGVRTVSGSFIMHHPEKGTFLYADCGVVISPLPRQLADIATESVKTWKVLNPTVEPVVAFLSFSTQGSAEHPDVARVTEGLEIFRKNNPDATAYGELQFDAALNHEIRSKKAPECGDKEVNCFVFPDLDAGNIAYKITQRLAGFDAYGPILQGMKKPFSDLSRGSTVSDIIHSAIINLLRSRS